MSVKLSVTTQSAAALRCDLVIAGIHAGQQLSPTAATIDQASGGALKRLLKRGDLDEDAGSTLLIPELAGVQAGRVLLVAAGDPTARDERKYLSLLRSALGAAARSGQTSIAAGLIELRPTGRDADWAARRIAAAAGDASYRFDQMRGKPPKRRGRLARVQLIATADERAAARRGAAQGQALTEAMDVVKDLANLPGNICTPSYLADQARALGKASESIKTTVLDEARMQRLGMGALLSVSRGSRQPAKLIVMEYHGGRKGRAPIVLVGKGLTFDAGGISIKPAEHMDEMKYDMCGGATVIGALKLCAELKLPLNVVGVVPASENLPDGDANKPGDIVTSMAGITIEILNTDAEGRLILADALTYARRFKPEVVIDMATLTGACIIALGHQASAVLGNDQPLIDALREAGETSGDRAWQLPLWDEYQRQIESPFADLQNIGGRPAGTITAACFLGRFTESLRWAHLDIAGVAWKSGEDKGATARPLPLLAEYLISRAAG